jgi:hypothetical protein
MTFEFLFSNRNRALFVYNSKSRQLIGLNTYEPVQHITFNCEFFD